MFQNARFSPTFDRAAADKRNESGAAGHEAARERRDEKEFGASKLG